MFQDAAAKALQRALFAATACVSIAAASSATAAGFASVTPQDKCRRNSHDRNAFFVRQPPTIRMIQQQQGQGRGQGHQSRSWVSRIATATAAPSVVQCQAAAAAATTTTTTIPWDIEENDSYYYRKMDLPSRSSEISHVIFGQLLQNGCIERYDVYQRINTTNNKNDNNGILLGEQQPRANDESPELIVADIELGSNLDGHEGIVHGGILAMLFDDAMGMAFSAMGIPMAVTANLTVDYRVPVEADSKVMIRVRLSRREGRKLYFTAQMTNHEASVVYAESTALYVIPRSNIAEDNSEEATSQ